MNTINTQPEALLDADEAAEWYESQQSGLGLEFILELDLTIERVASNPEGYEVKYREVRQVLLRRFPYSVYFIYENGIVNILAILHQKRTPEKWKKRLS